MKRLWQGLSDWWQHRVRCPAYIEPVWTVFKLSLRYFREDKVQRMGAALAYYTIFSLPAILFIIIGLLGFFLGEAAVGGQLYTALEEQLFPGNPAVAKQIENAVLSLGSSSKNWWATLLGLAVLVFLSTNIFYAIQDFLNRIFRVEEIRRQVAFLRMLVNRLLSFLVVLGVGVVVFFAILLNTVVSKISVWVREDGKTWIDELPESLQPYLSYLSDSLLLLLNLGVSLFVVGLFVVLLYRSLPAVRLRWPYALWGGFWVALFFWIGQVLLSYYLARITTASAYGAAGSLIILLVWVYYSAQLLFWGAEFIRAMYEYRREEIPIRRFAYRLGLNR